MIAVIGAGAMGSALAIVHSRAGLATTLLGTPFDDATIEACAAGRPHPALGIALPGSIDCRKHGRWAAVLRNAERIVLAVSSDGLADVAAEVGAQSRAHALWTIATKGWDADTLRTPTEVVTAVTQGSDRIVVLGGPALAPELVAGAPTVMVCAGPLAEAEDVAGILTSAGVTAIATDDVAGVEVAAAYKNVTAIAVGMCEGLTERLPENVYVHRYADARAAIFALGLQDMSRLAAARGGRLSTILGPAGAGDLYVTCLGGRNGNFGRLLGSGQTAEQALATIGSTVEGVANARAALALADEHSLELPAARAVDGVLSGELGPEEAIRKALDALGAEP